MSYQVLARKWRPKSFEQLVGQEHVVTVLVNALTQQRLHHAYLFTGTRGVGKTTIARIFAKSLNCQQGITATPCGVCDVCQDIDQGRFIDLLEVDAASRTKVDDTREILDNVQYAPSRGRYKVYLIDEVHMLSRSSFNALLKTLEEPPEHVKFILATTDPQKLPVTVLSRCLQFHLKALTRSQIEGKLSEILAAEQVSHQPGALTLLAKAARGSMRDSLSLTDQAIAQGQGNISIDNVQQMLGGVDYHWPYKILIALLKQDADALMQLSLEIASYAPSYSRLLAELLQLLHQVAMTQLVATHFDLLPEHEVLLNKFARAMSPEDVQLYYQIVLNGRKDLPYAADEQAAFDMVLLRLLAFTPMAKPEQSSTEHSVAVAGSVDFSDDVLPKTNISQSEAKLAAPAVTPEPLAVAAEPEIAEPVTTEPVRVATAAVDSQPAVAAAPVVAPVIGELELEAQQEAQHAQLTAEMLDVEQQAFEQGYHSAPLLAEPEVDDANYSMELAPEDLLASAPPLPDEDDDSWQMQASEQQYAQYQQTHPQTDAPLSAPPATGTEPAAVASEAVADNNANSAVAAALQTRNMLRSRKKQLGQTAKKSSDALARHGNPQATTTDAPEQPAETANDGKSAAAKKPAAELPDVSELPQQPFTPELINPAQHKHANQVDKWAHMIDAMSLGGRLRQLAIHSTIDELSEEDKLVLNLDQINKHLLNDNAQQQLEQSICQHLQRKISLEVNVVEATVADPYAIQSHINDKRQDYAQQLLAEDDIVQGLQQQFQATLLQDTIKAL